LFGRKKFGEALEAVVSAQWLCRLSFLEPLINHDHHFSPLFRFRCPLVVFFSCPHFFVLLLNGCSREQEKWESRLGAACFVSLYSPSTVGDLRWARISVFSSLTPRVNCH
jgi:hypothetical protein